MAQQLQVINRQEVQENPYININEESMPTQEDKKKERVVEDTQQPTAVSDRTDLKQSRTQKRGGRHESEVLQRIVSDD